jgi:cytoskeletal protein CcmA (bactofilin family)
MRKSMGATGFLALVMIGLWVSPGYGDYRNFFSAGFKGGANVTVDAGESIGGELIVTGANLNLGGDFQGGLKAFGANVAVPGKVKEELLVAGANVNLSGIFHDEVKAFAANVVLAGTFDEDVEVAAARVILAPTAVVKGNLRYAAAVMDRQPGSQVLGKLERKTEAFETEKMERWREKGRKVGLAAGIIFWVVSTAALILVGVLVRAFFSGTSERAVGLISDSPWATLGVGLVFLVVVPVALVIAMITLVGIPAAIIAGLLYMVFVYVSRVFIGVWIGRKVMGVFKRGRVSSFFWPLVIGIIILGLIGLIPFLGWLFRVFCLLVGLGALWLALWRSRAAEGRI